MRHKMKLKIFFLLTASLLLVFFASPCMAAANPGEAAHAAGSAAEKTLDDIVHRAETDKSVADFVFKRPGYDAAKTADYARFFSKNLLAAWAEAEQDVLQQNCQGHYIQGQICGIDTNPVTCRPDAGAAAHLYQTKEEHRDNVLISYQWKDQDGQTDETLYRLVKDGEIWKLDGIDCGDGMVFNME
jgi:hypothetical protein